MVPWMIAAWLAAYSILVGFQRNGIVCLLTCLGILVGKRLTPAPGLIAFLAVMFSIIVAVLWRARRSKPATSPWFDGFSLLVLWIAWGGMTFDWYYSTHCHHPIAIKPDRPVVCYGDSMTNLGKPGGYPRNLQGLISLPV